MVSLGTNLPGGSAGHGTRQMDWFTALASSPRPAVLDYAGGGERGGGGGGGEGGDRVELSGRVLANWGAKTANLVDSEGYGPDATVLVDLPLDWMSLAVLLGLARAGVEVVFAGDRGAAGGPVQEGPRFQGADLILTGSPHDWAEHPADLWTVSSGPGAGTDADPDAGSDADAGTATPAHAVDFLTEVRMQADQCHLPLPGGPEGLPGLVEAWADPAAAGRADAPQDRISSRDRGVVIGAAGARLDHAVAAAAAHTWARGLPVMLVPETTASSRAFSAETLRHVAAEGLGSGT